MFGRGSPTVLGCETQPLDLLRNGYPIRAESVGVVAEASARCAKYLTDVLNRMVEERSTDARYHFLFCALPLNTTAALRLVAGAPAILDSLKFNDANDGLLARIRNWLSAESAETDARIKWLQQRIISPGEAAETAAVLLAFVSFVLAEGGPQAKSTRTHGVAVELQPRAFRAAGTVLVLECSIHETLHQETLKWAVDARLSVRKKGSLGEKNGRVFDDSEVNTMEFSEGDNVTHIGWTRSLLDVGPDYPARVAQLTVKDLVNRAFTRL